MVSALDSTSNEKQNTIPVDTVIHPSSNWASCFIVCRFS